MTTLDMSSPGELRLVLRGAAENAILNTLRHWPHWRGVEIERDPADQAKYVSVTLITGCNQEATIREILWRSFRMTFPPEGGDRAMTAEEAPRAARRGTRARRD
jgi:hypothetical protein